MALCVAGDLHMSVGGKHYYGTSIGRTRLGEALQRNGLACMTEWDRIPGGMLRHSPIDHILLPKDIADRTRVTDAWEGITPDK
jgi:hypothetical protein